MKYVSIDIETTGLNPSIHNVVEIACVHDDLTERQKPVADLPSLRILMYRENWNCNPYCARLHSELWTEMDKRKDKMFSIYDEIQSKGVDSMLTDTHNDIMINYGGETGPLIKRWLKNLGYELSNEKLPRVKINVAGKNFAAFDWQFLKADCLKIDNDIDIRHRVIDVAPMFWQPGDQHLPDTKTCCQRANLDDQVSHTALADARQNVALVRHALLKAFSG